MYQLASPKHHQSFVQFDCNRRQLPVYQQSRYQPSRPARASPRFLRRVVAEQSKKLLREIDIF